MVECELAYGPAVRRVRRFLSKQHTDELDDRAGELAKRELPQSSPRNNLHRQRALTTGPLRVFPAQNPGKVHWLNEPADVRSLGYSRQDFRLLPVGCKDLEQHMSLCIWCLPSIRIKAFAPLSEDTTYGSGTCQ